MTFFVSKSKIFFKNFGGVKEKIYLCIQIVKNQNDKAIKILYTIKTH